LAAGHPVPSLRNEEMVRGAHACACSCACAYACACVGLGLQPHLQYGVLSPSGELVHSCDIPLMTMYHGTNPLRLLLLLLKYLQFLFLAPWPHGPHPWHPTLVSPRGFSPVRGFVRAPCIRPPFVPLGFCSPQCIPQYKIRTSQNRSMVLWSRPNTVLFFSSASRRSLCSSVPDWAFCAPRCEAQMHGFAVTANYSTILHPNISVPRAACADAA